MHEFKSFLCITCFHTTTVDCWSQLLKKCQNVLNLKALAQKVVCSLYLLFGGSDEGWEMEKEMVDQSSYLVEGTYFKKLYLLGGAEKIKSIL